MKKEKREKGRKEEEGGDGEIIFIDEIAEIGFSMAKEIDWRKLMVRRRGREEMD
jgi:hypothetical protein